MEKQFHIKKSKNRRENMKVYFSHYIKNVNCIIEAIEIFNFEGIEETVQFKRYNTHYDKNTGRLHVNIYEYIVQNGSINQVIQMKLILKTLKKKKATIN